MQINLKKGFCSLTLDLAHEKVIVWAGPTLTLQVSANPNANANGILIYPINNDW